MHTEIYSGGLYPFEMEALSLIQTTFSKASMTKDWKIFGGFQLADTASNEGEFDAVIVTHTNVIILELKHWNHGRITSGKGRWYKNNEDMGRSAVAVTQKKMHLLMKKLEPFRNQFSNKGRVPFIEFFVVFTGNADYQALLKSDIDKKHIVSLDEFLHLADNQTFMQRFKPHKNATQLTKDMAIFNEVFGEKNTRPLAISVEGYRQDKELFVHPDHLYREYEAVHQNTNDKALMRQWSLDQAKDSQLMVTHTIQAIINHEYEVLNTLKQTDYEAYNSCFRALNKPVLTDINSHWTGIFEQPNGYERFNQFMGTYGHNLNEFQKISLIKILFSKFAKLHELKIAHGDISPQSIWLTAGSDVALSNFNVAQTPHHQLPKSMVDRLITLKYSVTTPSVSAFQQDVIQVCLIAWHILQNKRLSAHSLSQMPSILHDKKSWFYDVILEGINGKFKNIIALKDAFLTREPPQTGIYEVDVSTISQYLSPENPYRKFPADSDGDSPLSIAQLFEIYLSHQYLVKNWSIGQVDTSNTALILKLKHFFEWLNSIQEANLPYLPKTIKANISTSVHCLYLVYDNVIGTPWNQIDNLDDDRVNELVIQLIEAVTHYHQLGYYFGNITEDNVILVDNNQLKFLDFIQLNEIGQQARYQPEGISRPTAVQQDNFAVINLIQGLCQRYLDSHVLSIAQAPNKTKRIRALIEQEYEQLDHSFLSLDRLLEGISQENLGKTPVYVIRNRKFFEPIEILPDNGKLYLFIDQSVQSDQIKINVTGIGGSIQLYYDPSTQSIIGAGTPRISQTIPQRIRKEAHLVLNISLQIEGKAMRFEDKNGLGANQQLRHALLEYSKSARQDTHLNELAIPENDLKESWLEDDQTTDQAGLVSNYSLSTERLWQTVLDTETESLPAVLFEGDIEVRKINGSEFNFLSYVPNGDVLSAFRKEDQIQAVYLLEDKELILGEVSLKHSSSHELALPYLKINSQKIQPETYIYLRTKQDRSSYTKRRNALERLLKKTSVISDLVAHFEPNSPIAPVEYGLHATDEDFKRYDRIDEHGHEISLNPQQRHAFNQLLHYGPVSLLQGPPGTGKTEFIAAMVHFLFEKAKVKNVLLVSQSHEAVNNAAERIRRHSQTLQTPLEIVRFSNREGAVSVNLKDVFSESIISQQKQLFISEFKQRVTSQCLSIGLDADFIKDALTFQVNVVDRISEINMLHMLDKNNEAYIDTSTYQQRLASIQDIAVKLTQVEWVDTPIPETLIANGWIQLSQRHGYYQKDLEQLKLIIQLAKDYLNMIDISNQRYESFLARSRQLVCGTCVGIGNYNIGIADNQYDWVIIDEAARSISSELAIAIQSAKRVLLVGDHKQLPPLYSGAHKVAIAQRLGVPQDDIDSVLVSDFERLFESKHGQKIGAKLLTQYRMALPIGELVSHCFYNGELTTGKRDTPDFYQHLNIPALKHVVTWLNTDKYPNALHRKDKGESLYNVGESEIIINVLKQLSHQSQFLHELNAVTKSNEASIGIICMYGEQKRYLRKKFNEHNWPEQFKQMVKIDTVDSYQGKENRIIIVSITRHDQHKSVGFLNLPNRINVALSRAMDRLIIVGSAAMWQGKNITTPLGQVFHYIKNEALTGLTDNLGSAYTVMQARHPNQSQGLS